MFLRIIKYLGSNLGGLGDHMGGCVFFCVSTVVYFCGVQVVFNRSVGCL